MAPTFSCSRSMMALTLALRSSRGFRVILRWPALGVGLSELTPTTVTTPSTSGSVRTASATRSCILTISVKETSGPASSTAWINPVSWSGRKPFGTIA